VTVSRPGGSATRVRPTGRSAGWPRAVRSPFRYGRDRSDPPDASRPGGYSSPQQRRPADGPRLQSSRRWRRTVFCWSAP